MNLLRTFAILAILIVAVGAITAVEVHFIKLPTVDISTRFLLIGLLTVNIIALLTLMFFVGKNVFRLYAESRQGLLGHKFQIKLASIFVIMLLLPSTLLFLVSSGLATSYINRIFSAQMKEPFVRSIELARQFYDMERNRALRAAEDAARGNTQGAYGMTVRRISSPGKEPGDVAREAFRGKSGTEVISRPDGDLIRAAVPDRTGQGVVVVELKLPAAISEKTERIWTLYEEYIKLESFKMPLRTTYILILGFITLVMVFAGVWIAMRLSRGITTPIRKLAEATEKIGHGDLTVQVEEKSEDEIGLLINSFNSMVLQLRQNREQLDRAFSDLQTRELYLRTILQNINSGVLYLNTRGRIQHMNKKACAILNVRMEDVEQKTYQELIQDLGAHELTELANTLMHGRLPDINQELKVNIRGNVLMLRVFVTAIRDPETAAVIGILIVFDDLTEIIKAQKAIAWQEVARRITHEIKNPLTPIKLSAERLMKKWQNRDADFDAVFERSTRTIITEVESLRHLVDVFTRYGKLPEIKRAPAEIGELIESVIALFRSFKELTLETDIADGLPAVPLDREQYKRVLVNIMDNAARAMKNRGVIRVTARVEDNSLVVAIADSGPGIPDHQKEQLFLPYFSQRKGGTGLGLAISDKIIKEHGGRILVSDNTPTGSVFTVIVPLQAELPVLQEATAHAAAPHSGEHQCNKAER